MYGVYACRHCKKSMMPNNGHECEKDDLEYELSFAKKEIRGLLEKIDDKKGRVSSLEALLKN